MKASPFLFDTAEGTTENGLSVIITTSLIPSAPSLEVISETVNSLKLLGLDSSTNVLIAVDGLKLWHRNRRLELQRLHRYREHLAREFCEPNFGIRHATRHVHLSGLLRMTVNELSTSHVLVVQHDLPFIRSFDVELLRMQMAQNPKIKHLRFNLRDNLPAGQDLVTTRRKGTEHIDRSHFFLELEQNEKHTYPIIQTLNWSDNNYLCPTAYLKETILPPLSGHAVSPEWVYNTLGTPEHHPKLGTYIFGGINDAAAITHLDGRNHNATRSTDGDFIGSSNRRNSRIVRLLKLLRRAWSHELFTIRVGLLRARALRHLGRQARRSSRSRFEKPL